MGCKEKHTIHIHAAVGWLKAVAIDVTWDVFHAPISPLNSAARKNMLNIVVTRNVFHNDKSWLKLVASKNILSMV
jgi:hypothetical protein